MSDEPTIHIDSNEVHEGILDHQVENCPTCNGLLQTNFGLGGGGSGVYGYCEPCQKIVWKCVVAD